MIGAVLLAAGRGARFGVRPKALLELDGVPLIRRLLGALGGAGVSEIVVVLGHHAAQIEPLLDGFSVTRVHNPAPDDGPVSSQRLGLAAFSRQPDAVIVALADQPLIEATDIAALIVAWETRPTGTALVHPLVAGERGNPVIFGAAVRAQILAADAGFGGRQWQAAHPHGVWPWISTSRHYTVDIDTEADRARFERDSGRSLRWPATA